MSKKTLKTAVRVRNTLTQDVMKGELLVDFESNSIHAYRDTLHGEVTFTAYQTMGQDKREEKLFLTQLEVDYLTAKKFNTVKIRQYEIMLADEFSNKR